MPSTKSRKARKNSAAELAANEAREALAKTAVASLRLEFVRHGCGPLWWPSYSAPVEAGAWRNHLAGVRSSMAQRADNFRRLAERETVAFPRLTPGERAFLAMFDKLQARETGPVPSWQLVACLGNSFTQRAIKADSLPAAVAELRRQLALCNVAVYAVPSFPHTLEQTGPLDKVPTTIQRPNKLYHLLLCQGGRCFAREVWQVSAVAACRSLLYKLQARQVRCRKAESPDGRTYTLDPSTDAGALLLVCGLDQLSETASYPD